jgi:hypothetical protein
MKKAQVTEFIIIGIVLLSVVAFLLYLAGSVQEDTDKFISSKTQSLAFNLFVQSCLETSSLESVADLGVNGGYLGVEGDRLANFVFLSSSNFQFAPPAGNIYVPSKRCDLSLNNCSFLLDPPIYDSLLPSLKNITSQLETDIESKMNSCVDLDGTSFNLKMNKGVPEVEISYDIQSTTINLEFPITLSYQDERNTGTFEHQINLPLRFRLFHTFLQELIYRDSADLGFDIGSDFSSLTTYFPGFSVVVDRVSFTPHDLITVKDGDSLEFVFLRNDYAPVLNFISKIPAGQTSITPLVAYDINEDDLTYSVSGTGARLERGESVDLITDGFIGNLVVGVSDGSLEDSQEVTVG